MYAVIVDGWVIVMASEQSTSVEGLACLVKGQVPQEHEARPVDGPPETALNCEALISKRKRSEREPIRTPAHLWRGVSVQHIKHALLNSSGHCGNIGC